MARIKIVTLVSVIALVFAAAQMAGADVGAGQQGDRPAGDPRTLVAASGSVLQKVKVVTSDGSQNFNTTTPTPITGATATMKVKAGMTALLDIRFSGESDCYDGVVGDWCTVTILVDGTEAYPQGGSEYAIDGTMGNSGDYWEGNISERYVKVGSGNHTVSVVAYVGGTLPTYRIDDWTLVVDQIKST